MKETMIDELNNWRCQTYKQTFLESNLLIKDWYKHGLCLPWFWNI